MPRFNISYYLILGLLVISNNQYAQIIDSKVCNKTWRFAITPYCAVLKTTNKLPVDSVIHNYQHQFQQAETKAVIFDGYNPYYYWFRFIIKNDSTSTRDLVILLAPLGMREGKLYQKKENKYSVVAENGLIHPFHKRSYEYAYYVFPVTLPPNTIDTVYLYMDASHAYKSYGFALMYPKSLRLFQNQVYFSFGIIVGLLLLFCLLNFYLFYSLRDKVHLWYALYIGILIWIVFKNDQLDQEFFSSNPEFIFRMAPLMGLASIAIALLMQVVLLILNLKTKGFLYKASLVAKLNALVSGLSHFMVFYIKPDPAIEQFVFDWADKSTILAILMIIVSCIYSIYKGSKNAIFLLAGILVFLVGAISRLLLITNSSYLFPPSLFHLGMVLETLIISFGLIYRYRIDRKEKNQYLMEKEELKNSFDKLILQSKFEIQEQTLKNISQEIHDNIGQILTLVKLNITNKQVSDSASDDKDRESIELLTKAISDLRDLSKSLNTDYVMQMGLTKAIEYNLEQIKRVGNYETTLTITGEQYGLEAQKELILFRMFQEVLNNIIKHAKARAINVDLRFETSLVYLVVSDNGTGFDADIVNSNAKTGIGLQNIRNRAAFINATFDIKSNENGTTISIAIPL